MLIITKLIQSLTYGNELKIKQIFNVPALL